MHLGKMVSIYWTPISLFINELEGSANFWGGCSNVNINVKLYNFGAQKFLVCLLIFTDIL